MNGATKTFWMRGTSALALGAAVLLGAGLLPACSAEAKSGAEASGSDVLATVGDKKITRDEVKAAAKADLEQVEMQKIQCGLQAKQQEHTIFEGKTKELVETAILEQEAAARSLTKDELLAAEVEGKIAEVSDADVDVWYEENKARIGNQPKEAIAPRIKEFLGQQRQGETYTNFVGSLQDKYSVAYNIEPYRIDVEAAGSPSKGSASAPVTIVEFSDFECPFCSRVIPTMNQVEEAYGDKVRVVFRQFPLRNIHPSAQKAAEASLCADDQGKFWELHDLMFAEQKQLTVPELKTKAERLEFDTAAFNECLDSDKYADKVESDLRAGSLAGVSGTPAMFVNGRLLSGAVPFEDVKKVIDEELERAGK